MIHTHFIILSSSYSTKTRIALHFPDDEPAYRKAVDKISQVYGGRYVSFSQHTLVTGYGTWDSVVEKDPYFDDVKVIDTVDEFIELILKDRYLSGETVARYILSVHPCTHTRLEKLTYFCYADYLCQKGQKLFDDEILAFDHGPVILSVYRRYSGQSHTSPGTPLDDEETLREEHRMALKSRILFSEDGLQKLNSIDLTLKRLEKTSTHELAGHTHLPGTPWSMTDRSSRYAEISDDTIRQYHSRECL